MANRRASRSARTTKKIGCSCEMLHRAAKSSHRSLSAGKSFIGSHPQALDVTSNTRHVIHVTKGVLGCGPMGSCIAQAAFGRGNMRSVLVLLISTIVACAQTAQPLHLEKKIELPDVQGRIDHMSLDIKGQRLFVAAVLRQNSVAP